MRSGNTPKIRAPVALLLAAALVAAPLPLAADLSVPAPVGAAPTAPATPAPALDAPAPAQDWCSDLTVRSGEHCEVRELALATRDGRFAVDARPNGSIQVEGWDGADVRVEARVVTRSSNATAARELADRITVDGTPGAVASEGPRTRGRDSWSVSYRVRVPRGTALSLESTNGSMTVSNVGGAVTARSTNGSIRIADAGGPIRARSTNGSIQAALRPGVALADDMELRTTNGAVTLQLPAGTSARLNASTTNGGITSDIPVTIEGQSRRQLRGVMGQGGPEIRISTTNGAVRIRQG